MNTQTERPARKPRNQRGKAGKSSKRYYKQTAHVEARRDGKPLVLGWGKHLSHTDKVRLQRRATWSLAALVVLLLAAVVVGSWINFNIVIPGRAVTTINGHPIPQSEYRQMVAVKTQLELNRLYGPNGLSAQVADLQKQDTQVSKTISQTNTQITDLTKQIAKLPPGPSKQRTDLTNQLTAANKTLADNQKKHQDLQNQIALLSQQIIPAEKQTFTQSQIGTDSATWLQDDELLREWLTTQGASLQDKINPTAAQVERDFASLKANMPKSNGYNTFLGQMGISENQIRAMLTIVDRRNNAQTYFSSLLVSPSYQVLAREIVVQTQQKANEVLQNIHKGQDFAKLAKQYSQDVNSNNKGGSLDWLTRYQYIDASGLNGPAVVDDWLFDPARHLDELSPILFGNGSYYIVQIMNIDPARSVDANLLKALQGNALVNWLQDRRALPGQSITNPDQTMLFDSNNLPPTTILPANAPATTSPGTSG